MDARCCLLWTPLWFYEKSVRINEDSWQGPLNAFSSNCPRVIQYNSRKHVVLSIPMQCSKLCLCKATQQISITHSLLKVVLMPDAGSSVSGGPWAGQPTHAGALHRFYCLVLDLTTGHGYQPGATRCHHLSTTITLLWVGALLTFIFQQILLTC